MDFEKYILIVVLCLFLASRVSDARILSDEEDLELERQLKLINKPSVKSIQTEFGHIVDCIDINKQAAFDHPLLKDHKIQRIPSFLQRATKKVDPSQAKPSIIGLAKGACPLGTVPIRKATKKDLIASKLLLNNIHPQYAVQPGTYRANIEMKNTTSYTGVKGSISTVNSLQMTEGQSYSQIYVYHGEGGDYANSIATGWMVAPVLYNDASSYFFAVWTSDDFKQTGCFNTLCPGFVQIDSSIYLGSPLTISVPFIEVSLQEDKDYNWWLSFQNKVVGYYPADILFNLKDARTIGWGGDAVGRPNGNNPPPVGSGVLAGNNGASSFKNIKYSKELNNTLDPVPADYDIIKDNPKCYELKNEGYKNEELGFTFEFGGPGGQCAN